MSATRSLARRPAASNLSARAREAALAHMLAEVAEDDVGVLRAASRARELENDSHSLLALPTPELERLGWTRQELRVALDARECAKEVPFYLKMTHERSLMRYRGQDGVAPGAEGMIINPQAEPAPIEVPAVPALPEVPSEDDR